MKGDFSRQTFDPRKHYDGVLMQQGRVQLDADWNEQAAIGRYRNETEATDVIGACGAPIHAAGFEITTDGAMLFIGQGRYYVDGLLVENDLGKLPYAGNQALPTRLAYDGQDQLDLPGADLKAALAEMAEKGLSHALIYLDVWQRHVTALEEGRLREVALGGPDTTTRIRTAWQVRLLPVATGSSDPAKRAELLALKATLEAKLAQLDEVLAQLAAQIAALKQQIDALSPRDPTRGLLLKQLKALTSQQTELQKEHTTLATQLEEVNAALDELPPGQPPTCNAAFAEWDALHRPSGLLNARAQPGDPSADPCELPPGAGYTRLENQLYRVEIHQPGKLGQATFKWSRDNGTVVTTIEKISGSSVFVDTLGQDEVLGFANGQWVELIDDTLELNGLPGQLAMIVDVKPATRELVLNPAPQKLAPAAANGIDPARHPKLRRWDQTNQALAPATENGVAASAAWLPLEDGVQVQFSLPDPQGEFKTGDYWLIPARTATGDLEWPPYETPNANPQAQPRLGIRHHRCRLALIVAQDGKLEIVADCRNLFPPLTELPTQAARQALHVEAINWANDGFFSNETFQKDGLRIRLDAPPDSASVSNDSILVTVDFPYTQNDQVSPNIRERLVVLGVVGIDPNDPQTITWRFVETQTAPVGGPQVVVQPHIGILKPRLQGVPAAELRATRVTTLYRINVTLRGRFLWQNAAEGRRYLDGQAFGRPVTLAGSNQVRTDLLLPSGDGVRSSDFESWFFLGTGQTQVDTLKVKAVVFSSVIAGKPTQTVLTVEGLPLDPDKLPGFKAGEMVNRIEVFFTRPVQPEGEFPINTPQSALVEHLNLQGQANRRMGSMVIKGDLLEFRTMDPPFLDSPGDYRLTVFAEDNNFGPSIRAQDDGSALDGDYDGQPGTDFVLPFRANG